MDSDVHSSDDVMDNKDLRRTNEAENNLLEVSQFGIGCDTVDDQCTKLSVAAKDETSFAAVPNNDCNTSLLAKSADDAAVDVMMKEGDRIVIGVFDETIEVICHSNDGGEASNDGIEVEMDTQSQDGQDDGRNSQINDSSKKIKKRKSVLSQDLPPDKTVPEVTGCCIFEYQWPPDRTGDWYVLQEQISEYLGVVSFKRKYPDIFRRTVDFKERKHLREENAVTEMQCDLGLTALRTDEVLDLMMRDYPDKYEEFTKALNKRRAQKLSEQNKQYESNCERNKAEYTLKKAIKSAADFNLKLKRERPRAYFDLQTFEVHRPRRRAETKTASFCTAYPVAVLPGQFQEYYKSYTPEELRYFPINTVLYTPHKPLKSIYADPSQAAPVDSDDEPFSNLQPPECNDDDKVVESACALTTKQELIKDYASSTKPSRSMTVSSLSDVGLNDNSQDSSSVISSINSKLVSMIKSPCDSRSQSPLQQQQSSKLASEDSKICEDEDRPAPSPRIKYKSCVRKRALPIISICSMCNQTDKNKNGELEDLISCAQCRNCSHPTCLDLTKEMVPVIKAYRWQCMECKACIKCKDSQDEEKMLFCDHCDRGYHTYCVGLDALPEGRWDCPKCITKQQQLDSEQKTDTQSSDEQPVVVKSRRGRPAKYPRTEPRQSKSDEDRLEKRVFTTRPSRAERMAQRNKRDQLQSSPDTGINDSTAATEENTNETDETKLKIETSDSTTDQIRNDVAGAGDENFANKPDNVPKELKMEPQSGNNSNSNNSDAIEVKSVKDCIDSVTQDDAAATSVEITCVDQLTNVREHNMDVEKTVTDTVNKHDGDRETTANVIECSNAENKCNRENDSAASDIENCEAENKHNSGNEPATHAVDISTISVALNIDDSKAESKKINAKESLLTAVDSNDAESKYFQGQGSSASIIEVTAVSVVELTKTVNETVQDEAASALLQDNTVMNSVNQQTLDHQHIDCAVSDQITDSAVSDQGSTDNDNVVVQ